MCDNVANQTLSRVGKCRPHTLSHWGTSTPSVYVRLNWSGLIFENSKTDNISIFSVVEDQGSFW